MFNVLVFLTKKINNKFCKFFSTQRNACQSFIVDVQNKLVYRTYIKYISNRVDDQNIFIYSKRINIQFIISITFNGQNSMYLQSYINKKKIVHHVQRIVLLQQMLYMLSFDMHTHSVQKTGKAYFGRLAFICLYVHQL